MQHTKLPNTIDRQAFRAWGNVTMLSSNNFSVTAYMNKDTPPAQFNPEEDTEMCAVACAAVLQIGKPQDYNDNSVKELTSSKNTWNQYGLDLFGVQRVGDISDIGNQMGYWVASQDWQEVDSTAKGAGQRILYMLENGVPDWSSIRAMMSGDMELCYSKTAPENDTREKIDVSKWFSFDEMVKKTPELVKDNTPMTYADMIPS